MSKKIYKVTNLDFVIDWLAPELEETLDLGDDYRVSDGNLYSLSFEQRVQFGKGRNAYEKWVDCGCISIEHEFTGIGEEGTITITDELHAPIRDRYNRPPKPIREELERILEPTIKKLDAESKESGY